MQGASLKAIYESISAAITKNVIKKSFEKRFPLPFSSEKLFEVYKKPNVTTVADRSEAVSISTFIKAFFSHFFFFFFRLLLHLINFHVHSHSR